LAIGLSMSILVVAAALASLLPARKAACIEPMQVLRGE
jgi:ABC-type lipoprotein release transport system permease subunit